jgi:uncharacterized membrane protein (UPF0127 family)
MVRFLFLITVFLFSGTACAVPTSGEKSPLFIMTEDGRRLEFQVELARTSQEIARGLMYREELPENEGMLFLFENEELRAFWMRNTYVPLDIIFLNGKGEIINIGKGEPLNERKVISAAPAKAVLEVVQGTEERLGLKPGDRIIHPALQE